MDTGVNPKPVMNANYSFALATNGLHYGFVIAEVKRYQVKRGCLINGYERRPRSGQTRAQRRESGQLDGAIG